MELKRLALVGFAALLVLLFVGFAVVEGIGDPSIPSDDVAIVEDAPEDLGTINKEQLDHAIVVSAAAGQVNPVPKPGDEKYDELKKAALGELLDSIWIQGQAEEMGFKTTDKEVEEELEKVKSQAFETEKQFEEFLKESHFNEEDINQRIKVQILSKEIQAQLKEEAPVPSKGEVEDYYEEAKSSQYTTSETRDVRIVVNKDKAKVEEAKAQLEKDDSVQSWEGVAKKYSADTTKNEGGLRAVVSEEQAPESLSAAAFAAPQGEVEGPIEESRGYVIFEVMHIIRAKTSSLNEVESQIISSLTEQASLENSEDFLRNYESTWASRTFCASEFTIELCANFKGDGRPEGALPACYEADPEEPAEECPAPVAQVKPALPGSVTLLKPEGEKLAQRPHPPGDGSSAEAAPEAPELIE